MQPLIVVDACWKASATMDCIQGHLIYFISRGTETINTVTVLVFYKFCYIAFLNLKGLFQLQIIHHSYNNKKDDYLAMYA